MHAGSTYFDSGEVMISRTAIMHEFYDTETIINDIAIIVLPGQLFGESKFLNSAHNTTQMSTTFLTQLFVVKNWLIFLFKLLFALL